MDVQFRSILRIRPLQKKENDDPIVLEPLPGGLNVVLHPPILKDGDPVARSPINPARDMEFSFARVFPTTASQERVYNEVGQPIARQAMEFVKTLHTAGSRQSSKAHVLISMDLVNSRIFNTCIGSTSTRKQSSDGILPRLIDSLFAQSKHHVLRHVKKNQTFGINISILQINQSKINSSDCKIYDLLNPINRNSNKNAISSGVEKATASMTSLIENLQLIRKRENRQVDISDKPVAIELDHHGIGLHMGISNIYTSSDKARDRLQSAFKISRQITSNTYQRNVFVKISPVLIGTSSGHVLCEGDTINILDVAAFDCKQRAIRVRDPLRTDVYTSLMHCLKSIRANQIKNNDQHQKIPFLQHQVTMLLQPSFSTNITTVSVTLVANVSPSIRDYTDKRILLTEVCQVYHPAPLLNASTGTEVIDDSRKHHQKSNIGNNENINVSVNKEITNKCNGNNSPDLRYDSRCTNEITQNSLSYSTTFSNADSSIVPLPPPVTPGFDVEKYELLKTASLLASAPMEIYEVHQLTEASINPYQGPSDKISCSEISHYDETSTFSMRSERNEPETLNSKIHMTHGKETNILLGKQLPVPFSTSRACTMPNGSHRDDDDTLNMTNEIDTDPFSPRIVNPLLDDPLFQHMATMSSMH